jgi:hypothetical protein
MRSQTGRGKPLLHVRSGFRLTGSANEPLALNAWRNALGFFTQALCLFCQTFF